MKKLFTLLSMLLSLVIGNATYGQGLTAQNATINLSGPDTSLLTATVTIVNSNSNSVYVGVARTARNLVPYHQTYFCWTACYSPNTWVAPDSILLAPGGSTSVFYGYVNPNGYE